MKLLVLNAILLSIAELSPADAFLHRDRVVGAPIAQKQQQHRQHWIATEASQKYHGLVSLRAMQKSKSDQGQEMLEDLMFREADAIFDTIDVNNDGEISNDELRGHLEEKGYPSDSIRMLFTVVDKNADGAISREEMRFAFSNYEISALYRAFGLGDELVSNNSGSDDKKEKVFDDAVSEIRSKASADRNKYTPEMLVKLADMIFDMIDKDGSGEIDVEELRMHFTSNDNTSNSTCFRQVGQAPVASVDSVLEALDINSDGVISREEMREGFKQYDPRALSKSLGLKVSRTQEM